MWQRRNSSCHWVRNLEWLFPFSLLIYIFNNKNLDFQIFYNKHALSLLEMTRESVHLAAIGGCRVCPVAPPTGPKFAWQSQQQLQDIRLSWALHSATPLALSQYLLDGRVSDTWFSLPSFPQWLPRLGLWFPVQMFQWVQREMTWGPMANRKVVM